MAEFASVGLQRLQHEDARIEMHLHDYAVYQTDIVAIPFPPQPREASGRDSATERSNIEAWDILYSARNICARFSSATEGVRLTQRGKR